MRPNGAINTAPPSYELSMHGSHDPSPVSQAEPSEFRSPPKPAAKNIGKGLQNYNDEDFDTLLELVERIDPLGSNEWSILCTRYNQLPSRTTVAIVSLIQLSKYSTSWPL